MSRKRSPKPPPNGEIEDDEAEAIRSVCAFKGRVEYASYREPELPKFIGNPDIEALPPINSRERVLDMLTRVPERPPHTETLKPEVRTHAAMDVLHFFQPLPIHLRLEGMISRMIRDGYLARNRADPRFYGTLIERLRAFQTIGIPDNPPSLSAAGFSLLGMSGMGKSTSTREILTGYPQIILHSEYHGKKDTRLQVVWLVLECPKDGTTVGLCKSFFDSMSDITGENYKKKYAGKGQTETDLILNMAWVAAIHSLGLLVIDETQDLSEAKSGGAKKLISFLVRLINVIGVQVMIIATNKLWKILTSEFRLGRRLSGQGGLIFDRLEFDEHWGTFAVSLWDIQYAKNRCELSSELSRALHEVSYGVPDLAIRIYLSAQVRAIETGKEIVNESMLRSAYRDDFRLMDRIREVLESEYVPESEWVCDADLPRARVRRSLSAPMQPGRSTPSEKGEKAPQSSVGAKSVTLKKAEAKTSKRPKSREGQSPHANRGRSSKSTLDREDDLRAVIAKGAAAQPEASAYQALLNSNYIAQTAEFYTDLSHSITNGDRRPS